MDEEYYSGGPIERRPLGYAGFWKRLAVLIFDTISCYFVIPIVFNLFFYYKEGQTLGCKVFGIRIVSASDGKVPSGGALLGRFFAKILSGIPFYLGYFWVAWDEKKQGWHDKLASTVVVEEREVHPAWVWLTNCFILVVWFLGVFASIAIPQFSGYSEKARDSERKSAVMSLSTILKVSVAGDATGGADYTFDSASEVLAVAEEMGYFLPASENDRCYYLASSPDGKDFAVFAGQEDENAAISGTRDARSLISAKLEYESVYCGDIMIDDYTVINLSR